MSVSELFFDWRVLLVAVDGWSEQYSQAGQYWSDKCVTKKEERRKEGGTR